MPLIAPAAEWDSLSRKMAAEVPEAFASEGRVLNLFEGEWKNVGFERHYTSAIKSVSIPSAPVAIARKSSGGLGNRGKAALSAAAISFWRSPRERPAKNCTEIFQITRNSPKKSRPRASP